MTPQKGGDGLGQLEFRLSGNSPGRRADEEHQTQQIALCQNGGGHGGGEGIQSLRDRNGPLVSAVLVNLAAFHDLFQLRCDALAHKLPLAAAGHGDDGVPVGDGADAAGGAAHGLTQLGGKVLHAAQQGIFFENHLAVPAGVDLQRVALSDTHGPPDLLGDDHPAQVVPLCQVGAKKFSNSSKSPRKQMVEPFEDRNHAPTMFR